MGTEHLLELLLKYQRAEAACPAQGFGNEFVRGMNPDGSMALITYEEMRPKVDEAIKEFETTLNDYIDQRVLQILQQFYSKP